MLSGELRRLYEILLTNYGEYELSCIDGGIAMFIKGRTMIVRIPRPAHELFACLCEMTVAPYAGAPVNADGSQ